MTLHHTCRTPKDVGCKYLSIDLIHQQEALVISIFRALLSSVRVLDIPVNPPDIVSIKDKEFRICTNNMEPSRLYLMKFLDSSYVIWKTKDGALTMEEVDL